LADFDDHAWRRLETIETAGPVAVLGDIHGRLDLLERLLTRLDALHPARKMPVFVVGDVVDRGPDSKGVVDLLAVRGARGVRGNHEDWFVRYAHGGGFDAVMLQPHLGGRATLASYGIDTTSARSIEAECEKVPEAHRVWVTSLPAALRLVVDRRPYWLVHAGVDGTAVTVEEPVARMRELAQLSPDDFLWPSRSTDDMAALDGPVITGHVPVPEPIDAGHAIAIDTGSGVWDDGALTAIVLPRRRFVSVHPDGTA
jgi:serine/threonine protein phosphatase 1